MGHDRFDTRFFNTGIDAELASLISQRLDASNWFILISSRACADSRWIAGEGNVAAFLSIQYSGYRIITIRLDRSRFNEQLETLIGGTCHIEGSDEPTEAINAAIAQIKKDIGRTARKVEFFVDRGTIKDELELLISP